MPRTRSHPIPDPEVGDEDDPTTGPDEDRRIGFGDDDYDDTD